MNKNTPEISAISPLPLVLLKFGMVLCLAGGLSFFLFACGSPKTSDSAATDSSALVTDSVTSAANGADTTVALDSVPPAADTTHR
ncbi:MAG TPA: hypothetical protein VGC22_04935 [Chitinophaga sp.]